MARLTAALAALSLSALSLAAALPRAAPADPGVPGTALQRAWESAAGQPSLSGDLVGASAYDITTRTRLAAIHASWNLTPGSVMKLFTSAAGLAELGPGFRYTTRAELGPAGPGGRRAVYLVGGADPFLEAGDSPDLERMARAVAPSLGSLTRVVGVSTLLRAPGPGAGWDYGDLGSGYAPSTAALTSERDEVQVTVTPGASAGDPGKVTLDAGHPGLPVPPPSFLHIDNRAVTVAASAAATLSITGPLGRDTVSITGNVPLGSPGGSSYLALANPPLLTATLFQAALARRGVHFSTAPAVGTLPAGSRVIDSHASPPLSRYLQIQNTFSVNEMAEQLYFMLGARRYGAGTPATADRAMSDFTRRAHLARPSVQVDGSGLSGLDEMSAQQATGLLAYAAAQPWFPSFEHSLIHVGRTGQCSFLCGYMDGTAADGTVWIKTGNLANQWNYAGYAHAGNGDLIAFALFFDGLPGADPFGEVISQIDQMTVDAAAWPDEPGRSPGASPEPAASVGPEPAASIGPEPAAVRRAVARITGRLGPGAVVSGAAVNAGSGTMTWSQGAGLRLRGGLLPRLATVAAALRDAARPAGARIIATGRDAGGTLAGSLTLAGDDDPLLTGSQLRALAARVRARGITDVTGGLRYVDPAASSPAGPAWPDDIAWEAIGQRWAPPETSLAVDGDVVTIAVRGTRPGHRPSVSVRPAGTGVSVLNQARTAAGGPAVTAGWIAGTAGYALAGSIRPGQRRVLAVAPADPAAIAARLLRRDLRAAGVGAAGVPEPVSSAPAGPTVARTPAPPLARLAADALTQPSDLVPFDLYGRLGRQAGRDVGDLAGKSSQIVDPSGIGAYDYVTAGGLATLLARAWSDPGLRPLTRLLARPWAARDAGQLGVAGYLPVAGGTPDAYVVMVSGLPIADGPGLAGRLAPRILAAPAALAAPVRLTPAARRRPPHAPAGAGRRPSAPGRGRNAPRWSAAPPTGRCGRQWTGWCR